MLKGCARNSRKGCGARAAGPAARIVEQLTITTPAGETGANTAQTGKGLRARECNEGGRDHLDIRALFVSKGTEVCDG
jgi:hypothetical protein